MKTMHEKKKKSIGSTDAMQQHLQPLPQQRQIQHSMSSMGFSSSNGMS